MTVVVAPATPTCQLSTTSLNFGTVSVGSFEDRALRVANVGGGVLNGSVAPLGCPEFVVQQDPMSSLGPGQPKAYTIRLAPTVHLTTVSYCVFPFDPTSRS